MEISDLHKEILELFKKYKFRWETDKISAQNDSFHKFTEWSDGVAKLLDLDKNKIYSCLSELYWSISSVQLSIGYSLISRETCQFPKGVKGEAFEESSVPNIIGISEIHLFYHLNNGWESLYRFWERLTTLIQFTIYPKLDEKIYFDVIVDKIVKDNNIPKNSKESELKSLIKYWNKTARKRNKLSHFESSPMKNVTYDTSIASIYGPNNQFVPKISYSSKNLINEINELRDSYYRVIPSFIIVKEYIEYYISKKFNLKMQL